MPNSLNAGDDEWGWLAGWRVPDPRLFSLFSTTSSICHHHHHHCRHHCHHHHCLQVYYTNPAAPVQPIYILVVALGMLVAFALRKLEIKQWELYVFGAGLIVWIGLSNMRLTSGIALCFVVPFIPTKPKKLKCIPHESLALHAGPGYNSIVNYQHKTKGFSSFCLMFFFMMCNAGVTFQQPGGVMGAVVIGRLIGKPLGIGLFGCVPCRAVLCCACVRAACASTL